MMADGPARTHKPNEVVAQDQSEVYFALMGSWREASLPMNNSPTEDEQDQAFAKAVERARERAKSLYLHREVAVNALSSAFDAGFEAAMEFYTSEEFELSGKSASKSGRGGHS
jgi:hypothetical protein